MPVSGLTIVVPTFNEADNVAALVGELSQHLHGVDASILFVDDSTDDTPDVIARVADTAVIPVRVVHRDVATGGLAGAVMAGLVLVESPWAVVMDGDLQHPPVVAAQLYRQALLGTSDVVVASRYVSGGSAGGLDGVLRRVVSVAAGRLAKVVFPRRLAGCSDPMSGFFAIRCDGVRPERVAQSGYKILLALLLHRRLTISEVPFAFAHRNAGTSKSSLREGLRFLRLLALLRFNPAVLFAVVGASGVLPNLAVVVVLTHLGVNYLVAAAVGTQLAVAWNFLGAEVLVFHDRRTGSLRDRAVRFCAVSETDLLRLPFVAVLVEVAGLSSVVATAITLIAALAARYVLTTRTVYKPAPTVLTSAGVTAATPLGGPLSAGDPAPVSSGPGSSGGAR